MENYYPMIINVMVDPFLLVVIGLLAERLLIIICMSLFETNLQSLS